MDAIPCAIINFPSNILILKCVGYIFSLSLEIRELTGTLSSRCLLPGGNHSSWEITAMSWLEAEYCSGVDNSLSVSTQL